MQTLASDLEYVLLNKLVPFEVDEVWSIDEHP